jgi:hypothetical protein
MTADNDPDEPELAWSPELRTWVSLLLFAHLFALVVAVTTYARPSGLQEQLHALFDPYLRNLHMTAYPVSHPDSPVSYPFARYHLTHATPNDVDFAVEVEIPGPDGTIEKIVIPPPAAQPLVRRRRYQALANAAGALATGETNDEYTSILPRAIAGSILKQRGATQGTVRCRAHFLPEIEAMGEVDSGRRAALENYRDIYTAQVFVSAAGVELLKKSTTLEVAPVESPPAGAKAPAGRGASGSQGTRQP